MLFGGRISVSLAGGPVSSSAFLPLPLLPDRPAKPLAAQPSPTPEPQVSTQVSTPARIRLDAATDASSRKRASWSASGTVRLVHRQPGSANQTYH